MSSILDNSPFDRAVVGSLRFKDVKRFRSVSALWFVFGLSGPTGLSSKATAAPEQPSDKPGAVAARTGAAAATEASNAAARPASPPPVGLRHALVAAPPPTLLPLAEVKPGMIGEAWTVFHGTKPEAFKIPGI